MKLLILGGTVFLGRHIVDTALTRGHAVTLFNRGQHNAGLYPHLEKLRGDRDGGLDVLKGRQWDAVIDTCGYVPRLVDASARLLAAHVAHYTLISSLSVYRDFSVPGIREEAAVKTLADERNEAVTSGRNGTYGPLKALCEQAAEAAMPGRVLHVRPGLIVGPYDPTDRFTYWPVRVARGGKVVAPPDPHASVQFLDARDLARWIVLMAERKKAGIYNATGPAVPLTFAEFVAACRAVVGSTATFLWASEALLTAQQVRPWIDLPLWVPETSRGFLQVDASKARSAGLTYRPLAATIMDTLRWAQSRVDNDVWQAGLTAVREAALLSAMLAQGPESSLRLLPEHTSPYDR